MIGGEMTKFDEFTMSLLTNERILDMHKNSRHAHQVWRRILGGSEVVLWTAVNAEGGQYFALFNIGESDCELLLDMNDLEISENLGMTELWTDEKKYVSDSLFVELKKHCCKAFLLLPHKAYP